MAKALLFSTLSQEELATLSDHLLRTVMQIAETEVVHFFPTLQVALEVAFTTHLHQEGETSHVIITQSADDKAMIAEYLRRIPERTGIYLIVNTHNAYEDEWWRQFTSPQFVVMMVDSGGHLGSN